VVRNRDFEILELNETISKSKIRLPKLGRREHGRVGRFVRGTKGTTPAIIMGGSVNGLSFARSLGRRGVPTLMLESDRLIGTYTRFANVLFLPHADESPDDWLELLDYIGAKIEEQTVIFPTSDLHVQLVSSQADTLKKHFRFLVPDIDVINRILNKRVQYGVAESAGVPIPRTYFPASQEEVQYLSRNISYPCILKPYISHVGRKKIHGKVRVVRSSAELVSEFDRVASKDGNFMVQEIIPGEDDTLFGYLGMWDGEELRDAWLTKQKIRQSNPFGDGSLQVSVEAEEVADLSRRLLRSFNYRGFVGVEFRFDARDRTYRLIEINPRTVSGNQLAISAGIDFPWLGYRYLTNTGEMAETDSRFIPGVKYVNEEWDLKAFLSMRKAGRLNFSEWIRSLHGVKARAIGAADDPYPFLVMLGRLVRAFIQDLFGLRREST